MPIVPAALTDEAGIRHLLESAGLPTADLGTRSFERFLVLREGERLIGAVGLEIDGGIALLRSLAVEPAARQQGAGTRLVEAAERCARECGVHELYLLTTTADRFFTARGYRALPRDTAPAAIQRSSQFATLCPSSSILMRKIP